MSSVLRLTRGLWRHSPEQGIANPKQAFHVSQMWMCECKNYRRNYDVKYREEYHGLRKPIHDCTFFPFGFLPFSRAAAAFRSLLIFPPRRPSATAAGFGFFAFMLKIYTQPLGLSRATEMEVA
jgi:hypothetical protein